MQEYFPEVILPACFANDRARFHVKKEVSDKGFDISMINALRRVSFSLLTVGLNVTPEQKSSWTSDLQCFHHELVEKHLESVPVHFLSVYLDDTNKLNIREDHTLLPFNINKHKELLSVLPNRFELRLDVTNESPTPRMITTDSFQLYDNLFNEMVDPKIVRSLFPSYNGHCKQGDNTLNLGLELFALPGKLSKQASPKIKLKLGFAITKANGRFAVVTKFGYLPLSMKENMEKAIGLIKYRIKDEKNKSLPVEIVLPTRHKRKHDDYDEDAMEVEENSDVSEFDATLALELGLEIDELDLNQLERKLVDFRINEWQLEKHKKLHVEGEYMIFIKTIWVFDEKYAIQYMIEFLREQLWASIREELEQNTSVEFTPERVFECVMLVSSPTIADIITERFYSVYYGEKVYYDRLRVVYCANVQYHPTDKYTEIKVQYKPIKANDDKIEEETVLELFKTHMKAVVDIDDTRTINGDNGNYSLFASLKAFEDSIALV